MKIESSRIPSQQYNSFVGIASGIAPTVSVVAISKAVKSVSSSFPDNGLTRVIGAGLKRFRPCTPMRAITYGVFLSIPGGGASLAVSEMINAKRKPSEWQDPKLGSHEWRHRVWDVNDNAVDIGRVAPLLALARPGERILTTTIGGLLISGIWP